MRNNDMKVQGFNHITFNVKDLNKSLDFHQNILGMKVRHRGRSDAYMEWGDAWICIVERTGYPHETIKHIGIDHVAFYISETDFDEALEILKENEVEIVRGPIKRGVGRSVNFLDPDGNEIELHTSTLEERMKVWQ